MILSDAEIREALASAQVEIDPPPTDECYNTTSVDLHFGEKLFRLKGPDEMSPIVPGFETSHVIDASKIRIASLLEAHAVEMQPDTDGSFILEPNLFVLGETYERIDLKAESLISARVEGRSTLARLGLVVHLTAPTIHLGFAGRIVLEMVNFGRYPIRLRPKDLKICQLILERVGQPPTGTTDNQYVGQRGVIK